MHVDASSGTEISWKPGAGRRDVWRPRRPAAAAAADRPLLLEPRRAPRKAGRQIADADSHACMHGQIHMDASSVRALGMNFVRAWAGREHT